MKIVWALCTSALIASCASKDPPADCGDSSMSIVTLQASASSSEDGEIRSCVDIHAASRSDATATTRGRAGSVATSRPGVIPWTNLTFAEAISACGRAGKVLCNASELAAIAPTAGTYADGSVRFDETAISALSPTSAVTEIAHRFDRLNPYDMVIRGETGKPAFPETTGSVAYWTSSPETFDNERDPRIPLLLGKLEGDAAVSGVLTTSPVLDPEFRHPLLGFRCCIHAKMRDAFDALPEDPRAARDSEDEEVPLAPQP